MTSDVRFSQAVAIAVGLLALLVPAAAWGTSPGTNGKIAFASNEELFTMDPDGSNVTRIPTASCEGLEPDWAPDGHTIAFIERCGPSGTFDLSVIGVDGSGLRRVYATATDDAEIDWSPDGSQVLFISEVSGNREIYLSDAGFTHIMNLTNNSARDDWPAWSPDGTKIAFSSNMTGDYEIYTMNTDGTGLANLTHTPDADDGGSNFGAGGPSWSPDGQRIAFDSTRAGGDWQVFTMSAAGAGVTQLTEDGRNREPAWSPDGRLIAFASDRTGSRDIFVMASDGTAESRLTTTPAFDERPDWQVLPRTQANLVSNGDFESPVVVGDFGYFAPPGFDSWTVESGSVDIVRELWTAASGAQSLDLNGACCAPATIAQTLSTTAGTTYRLTFAFAGNPDPAEACDSSPAVVRMEAFWGDTSLGVFTFDTTGHTLADPGWRTVSLATTASSNASTLRFASRVAGACGPTIDAVSVVEAPPPATRPGKGCGDRKHRHVRRAACRKQRG